MIAASGRVYARWYEPDIAADTIRRDSLTSC